MLADERAVWNGPPTNSWRSVPTGAGVSDFDGFLELIFGTFPRASLPRDPCKTLVNTNEMEGRAPGKSTKKRFKTDGETDKKLRRNSDAFFVDFD